MPSELEELKDALEQKKARLSELEVESQQLNNRRKQISESNKEPKINSVELDKQYEAMNAAKQTASSFFGRITDFFIGLIITSGLAGLLGIKIKTYSEAAREATKTFEDNKNGIQQASTEFIQHSDELTKLDKQILLNEGRKAIQLEMINKYSRQIEQLEKQSPMEQPPLSQAPKSQDFSTLFAQGAINQRKQAHYHEDSDDEEEDYDFNEIPETISKNASVLTPPSIPNTASPIEKNLNFTDIAFYKLKPTVSPQTLYVQILEKNYNFLFSGLKQPIQISKEEIKSRLSNAGAKDEKEWLKANLLILTTILQEKQIALSVEQEKKTTAAKEVKAKAQANAQPSLSIRDLLKAKSKDPQSQNKTTVQNTTTSTVENTEDIKKQKAETTRQLKAISMGRDGCKLVHAESVEQVELLMQTHADLKEYAGTVIVLIGTELHEALRKITREGPKIQVKAISALEQQEAHQTAITKLTEKLNELPMNTIQDAGENLHLAITVITGKTYESQQKVIEGAGQDALNEGINALAAAGADQMGKLRGALIYCKSNGLDTDLKISDFEPEADRQVLEQKLAALAPKLNAPLRENPRGQAPLTELKNLLFKFFPQMQQDNVTVDKLPDAEPMKARSPLAAHSFLNDIKKPKGAPTPTADKENADPNAREKDPRKDLFAQIRRERQEPTPDSNVTPKK